MSAFSELSCNSDRNCWSIGCGRLDLTTLHLVPLPGGPILTAGDLGGSDFAFVADPFRIVDRDSTFIFAEAWSRSTGSGQVAVFQVDCNGQVVRSSIVLAEAFHLSYPCVFGYDGDHYLLPEAWESGALTLYKAHRFPWEWRPCKLLLTLDYADPQVFLHKGVWYLFLNTDPLTNASAALFCADNPLGDWRPHPLSPIHAGDQALGRSAGRLIRRGRRILRFSQDCRQHYGQAVVASEILDLTPTNIHVSPLGPVHLDRPRWARSAFHHVDVFCRHGEQYALFDGY